MFPELQLHFFPDNGNVICSGLHQNPIFDLADISACLKVSLPASYRLAAMRRVVAARSF